LLGASRNDPAVTAPLSIGKVYKKRICVK